jgi:hypothetical protein
MEKPSNPSTIATTHANAARVAYDTRVFARRRFRRLAQQSDTRSELYSHLQWVGPGTFLVTAYIQKRLCG